MLQGIMDKLKKEELIDENQEVKNSDFYHHGEDIISIKQEKNKFLILFDNSLVSCGTVIACISAINIYESYLS